MSEEQKQRPDDSGPPSASQATEDTQVLGNSGGLSAFWQELKRRKVMRVAITYAVAIKRRQVLTFDNIKIEGVI